MSDARVSQLSYSRIYLFWKHHKNCLTYLISKTSDDDIYLCNWARLCGGGVEWVWRIVSFVYFLFLMQNELKTISVNQWIKWINRKTQCRGAEDLSDFQLDVHKKCSRVRARARDRARNMNELSFFCCHLFIWLMLMLSRRAITYLSRFHRRWRLPHPEIVYLSHFEWITNDEYTEQSGEKDWLCHFMSMKHEKSKDTRRKDIY